MHTPCVAPSGKVPAGKREDRSAAAWPRRSLSVNMTTCQWTLQNGEGLARQLQKTTPEADVLSLSSCCPLFAGFSRRKTVVLLALSGHSLSFFCPLALGVFVLFSFPHPLSSAVLLMSCSGPSVVLSLLCCLRCFPRRGWGWPTTILAD